MFSMEVVTIVGRKPSMPSCQRKSQILSSLSIESALRSGKARPNAPLICRSMPPNEIQSPETSSTVVAAEMDGAISIISPSTIKICCKDLNPGT